jgi:alpha-1,2-mannosyltransferase
MTMLNANLICNCCRVFIVIYIVLYGYVVFSGAVVGDFRCFYAASYKLLSGDPAGIYNVKSLYAAQRQIIGRADINIIAWYYPPPYLLLVAWLATLPYALSSFAWLAVTLTGYMLTVRKIAPHPLTTGLILANPCTFQNIIYGQNGFLSAMLLGQGLLLLERRPLWAGMILGLLVIKPHLGVLVVIALAAAGKWRALLAAGATATALTSVSIAMFGVGSWEAFYHTIPVAKHALETGVLPWRQMITLFAQARLWGADVSLAYELQAALTAVTVASVAWVWHKRVFPLAYIVLVVGALLATPYAYSYDLTIMGLAIAWYGWEGLNNGWMPGEKTVLVLAWFMPLIDFPVVRLINIKLVFIILLALLVLAFRRWRALG